MPDRSRRPGGIGSAPRVLRPPAAGEEANVEPPIVDIHCHTFNGDDLPMRGFIAHVGLHDSALGSVLARLLDAVVQAGSPGYETERARLDALLGARDLLGLVGPAEPRGVVAADPERELEAETDRALRELAVQGGPLLQEVGAAMQTAYPTTAGPMDAEARGLDLIGMARRAISWVLLYGRTRLELTQLLISNFGDRVDLFCPMSVDLGTGLGDVAKTTGRQQMELQEKISRLSMLGTLPGGGKARVHPFVAFDPLHEVRARSVGDVETPLGLVKTAIESYGFVGIKVFPPMGWRPIGNAKLDLFPPDSGERIDEALRDLYGWCEQEQVPLTAHCNRSNFANEGVADLAGPQGWIDVLEEFPALHLNLGHFGGVHATGATAPGDDWPAQIARAAGRFDHLYADVGNHPVSNEGLMEQYRSQLDAFFTGAETAAVRDRIMYGSDWFMEALHPEADQFLTQYEKFFGGWGADVAAGFLGGRALRFLGFDDATNRNAQRLRLRYLQIAKDRTPAWLG
jgi:predicted TIM-barrel fold metal-dependent hydrolase